MSLKSNIQNLFKRSQNVNAVQSSVKAPVIRISPIHLDRKRHDIQMWRAACTEAENSDYPFRVKMQRMYLDTILNEHLKSCWRRRKNLTLLRKFKICDEAGNPDDNATKILQATWFGNFQSFALDALLFGYNLIELGDIENGSFKDTKFIKRENVSPDRKNVGAFVYSPSGQSFLEDPFKDWYIYVSTPGDTGASQCGYGLLYEIAKTEILLRNNTGQNADYNEVFGQPIRKGKTTKIDNERNEFEKALQTMGSNAYIILDDGQDDLELITAGNSGSAYQTYENFEKRGEAKISKILLGHADALDSVPGQLGAGKGEDNPVVQALLDIQSEDAEFLQPIINNELLPRMRLHGFNIPEGKHFEFMNDEEKEQFRQREDESNKKTADLFKTIVDAGGDPDWKYFTDRTGIDVVKKPEPPPPLPPITLNGNGKPKPEEIKKMEEAN